MQLSASNTEDGYEFDRELRTSTKRSRKHARRQRRKRRQRCKRGADNCKDNDDDDDTSRSSAPRKGCKKCVSYTCLLYGLNCK